MTALAVAAALGRAGSAEAQQSIVLYTSNDATLNKLVATEFTKATGIQVDVVSAGSGVVIKRVADREGPPAGRHRLGHQPLAAADQRAVFRPLRLGAQGRDPGRVSAIRRTAGSAPTSTCWWSCRTPSRSRRPRGPRPGTT